MSSFGRKGIMVLIIPLACISVIYVRKSSNMTLMKAIFNRYTVLVFAWRKVDVFLKVACGLFEGPINILRL